MFIQLCSLLIINFFSQELEIEYCQSTVDNLSFTATSNKIFLKSNVLVHVRVICGMLFTVSLFIVVAYSVELKYEYNNSDVHVFVNFIVKV